MVLARLYEEDASGGALYTRILKECLLGQGGSAHEPTQGKRNLSWWLITVVWMNLKKNLKKPKFRLFLMEVIATRFQVLTLKGS